MWYLPESLLVRSIIYPSLGIVATVVPEWTCRDRVQKLWSTPAGRKLYLTGIALNVANHVIFGSLCYYISVRYFCVPMGTLTTALERFIAMIGVLMVEGFLYYCAHMAFHRVPGLYWIHKFHHKYHNDIVLPSAASAVSPAEFVIAYMVPIAMGCWLARADEVAGVSAGAIISITNVCIHTPWLASLQLNWIFVSPQDHLNHHGNNKVQGTASYGAPVFHCDRILGYFGSILAGGSHISKTN